MRRYTATELQLHIEKKNRIADLAHFFNLLYGKIPAGNFVYLGTKQQGRLFFNHSFMIEDFEAMARKAIELSDCGVDVWHSVNPVNVEPKDGKRGDESVVSFQTAIVVDIDIRSDAHKGNPSLLAADFDEAKSFLPFTPSLIIHSGYGLHAYYIWAEPLAITDQNREEIKRRNNLLLDVVKQKAKGKKIDGVEEQPKLTADLIFSFDPILDGLFGYDQFQQADVFLKPPVWNLDAKKGDEWTDADDAQLQTYIRDIYTELVSDNLILKNIICYSRARAFHEVKEFFHNLPTWDGKKRAEKLFVKFLGADDSPYVREVTLNVLTAAVARIFHPGCDYQLAPILLGEQGIGKSYILGKLFGKWYGSLVDDVSDPHAIDAIQKLWSVEIKEMAAMKKDVDANKRFIDSARDTRRQAYARRATTVPRHCVFFITTNNKMCLTDMTGNRRYPIIVCHNKARHYVEGLSDKYILQVWAEVFAHFNELFKDGFDERKLELSRAAQIQSDEIAEDYLRDDGMESEIRAHLDTKILPLIIWYLLSREERRKFFVDGGRFQIELADLEARFKNRYGKKSDTKLAEFEKACEVRDGFVRKFTDRDGRWQLVFYGSELREHICAVEIYNECFGNDKRKSPTRINEILHRIDNWNLGARIQKADPAYLDQKKVFYRDDS